MQFTFTWQQKNNSLCLQTLNLIVVSMFVFLGFAVLWAGVILSHSVYIYLSFSPEVRSLPPAETQAAVLSLGGGDLQFICFENKYRVSKGLFCWEGWAACSDLEYMDDIPSAGLVRTVHDPVCFASCCLSPRLDEKQEHQQQALPLEWFFLGIYQNWHRKKMAIRGLHVSGFSTCHYSEKRGLSSGI